MAEPAVVSGCLTRLGYAIYLSRFQAHATQRMFQRQISEEDVRRVLVTGEIIQN